MSSYLDSQFAGVMAKAFKGQLSVGTLRQERPTALNAAGDPKSPIINSYQFDGIRDNFDASYAARALIPDTDVRVLIIAGSLPQGIAPRQNDKIFIRNLWHIVRRVISIDPATATYTLQCYVFPGP